MPKKTVKGISKNPPLQPLSESDSEDKLKEETKTELLPPIEKSSNKKVKTESVDKKIKTTNKTEDEDIDYPEEEKADLKHKGQQILGQTKLFSAIKNSSDTETLLPREFYTKDVVTLSRELLGKIIVRRYDGKVIKCRIVEAEAYAGAVDKACHAYNFKKTPKVLPMYNQGGHVYVYSIYGDNNCLNITASQQGDPSATLIRAVEPIEGFDICLENRKCKTSKSGKEATNGPGKLCAAMNINKDFNGFDVTKSDKGLYIIDDGYKPSGIVITKRINIDYSEEFKHKPWRFCIKDNVFVSVKSDPMNPSEEDFKIPPLQLTATK